VDYAIHAPVVSRYHWHALFLENLFVESKSDYEISQMLGQDNVVWWRVANPGKAETGPFLRYIQ